MVVSVLSILNESEMLLVEVIHRFFRQFIPRPASAEDLAVFTLCLESLPQHEPVTLHLADGPEARSLVYPSQEFKNQQWLYNLGTDRWQSESQSVEWAYEILVGEMVETLSFHQIPLFLDGVFYPSLYGRKKEQLYTPSGQQQRMQVFSNPQTAEDRAQAKDLSIHEVAYMLDTFRRSSAQSPRLHLWLGSFLEIAEKKGPMVLRDCARGLGGNSLPLAAFSTNSSQVLTRMAGQLVGREPAAVITDAQVLSTLLPWGSRSLMFHHQIHAEGVELLFNFCYLKPLATYAPIRVEFLAAHFQESDVPHLLDQILAHFILNPDIIS